MTTRPEPSVIYRNTGDPDDAWNEATGNTFLAPSLDFETCCVCGPCASAITRTIYEPTLGRLQAMFEAEDVGGLWNFVDTSGLFVASNGTTAASVGSPIGYMADVSRADIGQELVVGETPFISLSAVGASYTDGVLLLQRSADSSVWGAANLTIERNSTYEIAFSLSAHPTAPGALYFTIRDGSSGGNPDTVITAPGQYSLRRHFISSTAAIQFLASGPNTACQVSGLSVRKVPGSHAIQATTANKPTLRQTPTTNRYWLEAIDAARALNVTFSSAPGTMYTGRVTPEGVVWATETWDATTKNLIAQGAYNAGVIARDREFTANEKALVDRYFSYQLPADGEVV